MHVGGDHPAFAEGMIAQVGASGYLPAFGAIDVIAGAVGVAVNGACVCDAPASIDGWLGATGFEADALGNK